MGFSDRSRLYQKAPAMTTAICTHCQVAHAVVDGKLAEHYNIKQAGWNAALPCPGSGMAVEREEEWKYLRDIKQMEPAYLTQLAFECYARAVNIASKELHDHAMALKSEVEQRLTKLTRADALADATEEIMGEMKPSVRDGCKSFHMPTTTTVFALQSALTAYETENQPSSPATLRTIAKTAVGRTKTDKT